jgi:hypothetical protein
MADLKITQLGSLNGADAVAGDLVTVVDITDTTMSASGTNKKMTLAQFQAAPFSAGTANGVVYLNGSKVPTSGSALTFDGVTFAENGSPVVVQTDIGRAPNEIPLNQYLGEMAYMNAEAVVIQPQASVTPNGIGDMVFQLTSDTSLEIKVKGSDGTVRSVALTLA